MIKKAIWATLLASIFLFLGCNKKPTNILGQGFLKTKGGDVKTCAGNTVFLEKEDGNSSLIIKMALLELEKKILIQRELTFISLQPEKKLERLKSQYFSLKRSTNRELIEAKNKLMPKIRSLKKDIKNTRLTIAKVKKNILEITEQIQNYPLSKVRQTICNAQGNYEFSNIMPGKYIIGTTVSWTNGEEIQGGVIYKNIDIKEGQNNILITK